MLSPAHKLSSNQQPKTVIRLKKIQDKPAGFKKGQNSPSMKKNLMSMQKANAHIRESTESISIMQSIPSAAGEDAESPVKDTHRFKFDEQSLDVEFEKVTLINENHINIHKKRRGERGSIHTSSQPSDKQSDIVEGIHHGNYSSQWG